MTVKTINYTNWSTVVFPGFYESELYNSDTIYNINEALDDGDPAMDFTDNGFTEYCDDVARQAAEALAACERKIDEITDASDDAVSSCEILLEEAKAEYKKAYDAGFNDCQAQF